MLARARGEVAKLYRQHGRCGLVSPTREPYFDNLAEAAAQLCCSGGLATHADDALRRELAARGLTVDDLFRPLRDLQDGPAVRSKWSRHRRREVDRVDAGLSPTIGWEFRV